MLREADRDYLHPSPPGPGGRGNTIALMGLLSSISLRHLIKIVLYYNAAHRFPPYTPSLVSLSRTGGDQSLHLFKFCTDAFSGLRAGDVCKSGHGRLCFVLFVSKGLLVW